MKKIKIFHLEDLELSVPIYRDEISGKHMLDYPIFTTQPLYTKTGHPCVNAWQEACAYIKPNSGITVKKKDCGCCEYYHPEQETDLIGVCMCENNRIIHNNKK